MILCEFQTARTRRLQGRGLTEMCRWIVGRYLGCVNHIVSSIVPRRDDWEGPRKGLGTVSIAPFESGRRVHKSAR